MGNNLTFIVLKPSCVEKSHAISSDLITSTHHFSNCYSSTQLKSIKNAARMFLMSKEEGVKRK